MLPSALAWYPQWSAGDTRIVYSDVREGRRGVFEVALDGGEVRELLTLEEASVATSIGPDGTRFAYVSDEEGVDEVSIRQLPDSGKRWRVSTAGGSGPVWSRDGRELVYRQGNTIMAARVTGSGSALQISQPEEVFTSDRIHLDRFGNPTFDTAPDGSLVIPLREPLNARTRVVLNWKP